MVVCSSSSNSLYAIDALHFTEDCDRRITSTYYKRILFDVFFKIAEVELWDHLGGIETSIDKFVRYYVYISIFLLDGSNMKINRFLAAIYSSTHASRIILSEGYFAVEEVTLMFCLD